MDAEDGYHIQHGGEDTAARFICQLRMRKEDCTYVRILYHTHSMAGVIHGLAGTRQTVRKECKDA
jgi:hypothetical protein